jgi:hypothetical protein
MTCPALGSRNGEALNWISTFLRMGRQLSAEGESEWSQHDRSQRFHPVTAFETLNIAARDAVRRLREP